MVLNYQETGKSEEHTSGKIVELDRTVVLDGEEYEEITLATGMGFGDRTCGVFIDNNLIVEGQNEFGALANLVDISDNLDLEVIEKE